MKFWAAQFGSNRTDAQNTFDVAFGVALPILCFVADPFVFKGEPRWGLPLLADHQLVVYVISTVEMGLFLLWRTFPRRLSTFAAPFAGVFLAGSIFSTAIGVAILPFSLVGLLLLIGVLGLTPFLTAFAYLRNGVRALNSQVDATLALRLTTAALSGILMIGSLVLACQYRENAISASIDTMVSGNVIETRAAASKLKSFRFIPRKHLDRISVAYGNEFNPIKRDVLKDAYKEITGEDLEIKRRRLAD
jgi:hypothetical protein